MNPESIEKAQSNETVSSSEVKGESNIDALGVSEKVREVAEVSGEDIPQGSQMTTSGQPTEATVSQSNTRKSVSKELPSLSVQRKSMKRFFIQEKKKVRRAMRKVEKAKVFRPEKMEALVEQLRKIQSILKEIMEMAEKSLTHLYKKYIQKSLS